MKLKIFLISLFYVTLLCGQSSFETHVGYNLQHFVPDNSYAEDFEILKYDKKSFYADFAYTFLENKMLNQKVGFSYLYRGFDIDFNNIGNDCYKVSNLKLQEKASYFQLFYIQKLDLKNQFALKPELGLGTSFLYHQNLHQSFYSEYYLNSGVLINNGESTSKFSKEKLIPYLIIGLQYEQNICPGKSLTFECLYSKNWNSANHQDRPNNLEWGLHDMKFNVGYKQDVSENIKSYKLKKNLLKDSLVNAKAVLEIGVFGSHNYSELLYHEDPDKSIYYATYDVDKTKFRSNSFGVNFIRSGKFVFQHSFYYKKTYLDYFATLYKSSVYSPDHFSYSSTTYASDIDLHYTSVKNQLLYSFGFGVKVFSSHSKFNIIPMLSLQFPLLSNKYILFDEAHEKKTTVYYSVFTGSNSWASYDALRASKFLRDYSNGENILQFTLNFKYSIQKNLNLQLAISKVLDGSTLFQNYNLSDRYRYQFSLGMSYKFKGTIF